MLPSKCPCYQRSITRGLSQWSAGAIATECSLANASLVDEVLLSLPVLCLPKSRLKVYGGKSGKGLGKA